jgi:hypothetical protein
LALAGSICTPAERIYLSRNLYKVPVQVDVLSRDVVEYILECTLTDEGQKVRSLNERSLLNWKDDRSVFPLKDNVGAKNKVNVFFRDVWTDALVYHKEAARWLSWNQKVLVGMFNDEATAWLIWFCGAWEIDRAVAVAVIGKAKDYGLMSELSDCLKQSGCGRERLGRYLMELRSLCGRGSVAPDPDADVEGRIDKRVFESSKSCGIGEEVRRHVRDVLKVELAAKPLWPSKEDYWDKRWLYTKAGSHARRIETSAFGEKLDLPPQPTRREFSESVSVCLVAFGTAAALAGQSWKLEHYKTRAIYSCDTVNYFTFDYLLRPVEAVWGNVQCLLDPGARERSELYSDLSQRRGVRLMIDFEDYNSQHTHEAMKIVIEEACRGAPDDVLKWALDSIDNEWVFWKSSSGEEKSRKTVGGLFSGHRATTFINTILNAAYCRLEMSELYAKMHCLHAGDDVICTGACDVVDGALTRMVNSSIRMNPSKQGVGTLCGEFLRVSYSAKGAGGYCARSIAGLVSGNWTSDAMLSEVEAMNLYTNMLWTMVVRSEVRNLGLCLVSTIRRRVPSVGSNAFDICRLQLSVNGSPVLENARDTVGLLSLSEKGQRRMKVNSLPAKATDKFIERFVNKHVLDKAGVTVGELRTAMLEASHKDRSVFTGKTPVESIRIAVPSRDVVDIGIVARRNMRRETRTTTAAATMLKRLVGRIDWEAVISSIAGSNLPLGAELEKARWPIGNSGTLGYQDLASIRNKMVRPLYVSNTYPVRS